MKTKEQQGKRIGRMSPKIIIMSKPARTKTRTTKLCFYPKVPSQPDQAKEGAF
jgi:hypothetical protein